jgi:hypothetical protein
VDTIGITGDPFRSRDDASDARITYRVSSRVEPAREPPVIHEVLHEEIRRRMHAFDAAAEARWEAFKKTPGWKRWHDPEVRPRMLEAQKRAAAENKSRHEEERRKREARAKREARVDCRHDSVAIARIALQAWRLIRTMPKPMRRVRIADLAPAVASRVRVFEAAEEYLEA